ncbi:NeuD/PglB/VioB family sugar acetyltransferase [Cellulophaga sp. HaHaR_3_176]|uniref:NeuD/PglB/VioB family sugar acetyltransferase n=1 Tax=Cellulophaga sp. HaHaR_3_176 TaxID=1942464 RepID=UPI001C1FE43B|nr:NeuD/PglB/VioB family sugar acetyltransferase [Cellulophaga sp. HaHaR_3_176]QWX84792.1 NeuD/PglB/VioB family sugar acetyltransferase [Cellulophaga sp. HaHaR_3_176]
MIEEKKNIVIIGASGHAKVIIDIIERNSNYIIVGLIDSFKSTKENVFDYNILGTENDILELSKKYNFTSGIIAIGDNWTRKKIHDKLKTKVPNFEYINAIHPNACLGKNITIGVGVAIMPGVIINSDSKVGDFCILNTNSSLDHDGLMGNYSSLAPNATLGGNVTIGKCTAISLGANIIQEIKIGDYSTVGAGSLVNKDIGDLKLVYGVPAKKIRDLVKGEKYLYKHSSKIAIVKEEKSVISDSNNESEVFEKQKSIDYSEYKLNCHDLITEEDIATYKKQLTNFDGFDAFYKPELFSIKNTEQEKLKYFTLEKNNETLFLMPFSLRKIIIKEKDTTYKDVSSFYGYSGPLYNEKTSPNDLEIFWSYVDNWYKNNKVISEFIRFNLEGNYNNYSGKIIPTLNNVKGEILEDKNEQWDDFASKVRNNYRKAISNNLEAKIFHKEIDESVIEVFHEIYINTMKRNQAENNYFFSLSYFKNLILSNPKNTALILIYKDNTPISTELILLNKETMYSFLGGTTASYFELRPNDFLKMEAMNWGRENGFKKYILGGGRANNDSLYKYKKSFFPNNNDVIYYTGRKVLNERAYEKLVTLARKHTYIIDEADIVNEYFPLYRK